MNIVGDVGGNFSAQSNSIVNIGGSVGGNLGVESNSVMNVGEVVGGNLNVQSGARIALTGTATPLLLAQTDINPSISKLASIPSSSLNTLQVGGTVNFASGGIYQVKTDPGNSADHLFANGSASLEGGQVAVKVGMGNYNRSITYNILTANGGVNGRFDNNAQPYSLLGFKLTYDLNNVYLTVQRNDTSIEELMNNLGGSRNQRSVGRAIDSLGGANRLNQAIVDLNNDNNDAAIRDALNQVSGEL
ncbi:hypothetical protein HZU77_016775, partial [Neisseriaceae bacterium TC5R-5]|nr:hypothetical protein [Neisseriaceae bacterium TC5R-5]